MGDEAREGFLLIYDECFSPVWAYAVSRVGRQAAEEVVSETFAVAWRRRSGIPPDPLPWLLGVARNVAHQMFRAEVRQQLLAAEAREWMARLASAEDPADAVVDRAQLLWALAALSDADQEVLLLVAWHGLSTGQAAEALRCSRAAFFLRLHRARRRLEYASRRTGPSESPARGPRPRSIVPTEVVP
jgi:RNA polymerase sigma-70 factor (ECF subfamily)